MKKLYYILNLTWGLPMNIIGGLVATVLVSTGHKPKKFEGCYHFVVGKSWGGLNLGLFILTDEKESVHTKTHEFGHSIQNAMYGIFMPFIVAIPSVIRYWYRAIRTYYGLSNVSYDDIWFEGQASKLGYKYKHY